MGRFFGALSALGVACAPLACSCKEPVVPEPSCLSGPRDFKPDAATTEQWAEANGDFEALPAAMRLNQCNTKFGQVETTHCSAKIDAFCSQRCSPNEQQSCMQTQRELLMQDCREQSFSAFIGALPSCCPVKLEGSALVSTTAACPP